MSIAINTRAGDGTGGDEPDGNGTDYLERLRREGERRGDECWTRWIDPAQELAERRVVEPYPLPGVTGVTGPGLAAALDQHRHAATDPQGRALAQLSPGQLIAYLNGAARLSRWADSTLCEAIVALSDYAAVDPADADRPITVPGAPGTVEVGYATAKQVGEFCSDQLGAVLNMSHYKALQTMCAAQFAHDIPEVQRSMADGTYGLDQVRIMTDEFTDLTDEPDFITDQLAHLSRLGARQLRDTLRAAVLERRPDTAQKRHRRARTTRGVAIHAGPDGMATVSIRLTAQDAQLAFQAIKTAAYTLHDAKAAQCDGDCSGPAGHGTCTNHQPPVTLNNRRADAFMIMIHQLYDRFANGDDQPFDVALGDISSDGVPANGPGQPTNASGTSTASPSTVNPRAGSSDVDHAERSSPDGAAPTGPTQPPDITGSDRPDPSRSDRRHRRRRRPRRARVMLHVFISANTLAGLDNQPGHLLGYGAITADQARETATQARIQRILTDPITGDVQALDTPGYRVPDLLRWATIIQHRTCTFPGCTVSAIDCQLDHREPHPGGRSPNSPKGTATGTTRLDNLLAVCERHHRIKTHGGWSIEAGDGWDHTVTWIDPYGNHYQRHNNWKPPLEFRLQIPQPERWPDLNGPQDQTRRAATATESNNAPPPF